MKPYLNDTQERIPDRRYTQVVCAIAFWVFSFVYLFFYQAEVLSAGQHVLSGGRTYYHRLIGAFLITLALYLLQRAVAYFVPLYKRGHALTYFPSLLILTLITDFSPDTGKDSSMSGWWIAIPVLAILYFAVQWVLRQIEPYEPEDASPGLLSRTTWVNLLSMCIMFVAVGIFSNGDESFHYRMRMEQLITERKYTEALQVGRRSMATDPPLTMLRAYALSQQGLLGDRFFHYPVAEGTELLAADSASMQVILIPDSVVRAGAETPRSRVDNRLMNLLLHKDLGTFAAVVSKVYPDSLMPKHYEEALVYYHYYSGQPMKEMQDHVTETDFMDFRKMEKEQQGKGVRNQLRRTFGNTYWYYYKYGGKK